VTSGIENVFISYRRKDSAAYAGRLRSDLAERYGQDRIFMDLAIEPGADFAQVLRQTIEDAAVMLVVVGPNWLRPQPASQPGEPAPQAAEDWVALEVGLGLSEKILVIPVLVGGAHMPAKEDLPESIRDFHGREAIEITDSRWDFDVGKLFARLDKVFGLPWYRRRSMLAAVGGAVAAVIGILLVLALTGGGGSSGAAATDDGLLHLGDRTLAAETPPMTGNDVVELQRILTRFGYYAGPLNGEFDGATANAVTGFKACWDLTNNTAVDAATVVDLKKQPTKLATNQDDQIVGTQGDDIVYGLGGNDTIDGLGGNDVLCGGGGNDTLIGRDGDDHLGGGGGNDKLFGNEGADVLHGGFGQDDMEGGPGPDVIVDQDVAGSVDTADGGDGDDACRVLADDVQTNCERG
jgi:hypothetical protein